MIIKRVGGKSKLAEWIKSYLPACRVFVDVFGGSGAVLDCMIQSGIRSVFNDLDKKIYTFFRVLQNSGSDLAHLVNLTPYSRQFFNKACEVFNDSSRFQSLKDIDKALTFLIMNRQSFGSKMLKTWSITRDGEVNYETWNNLPKYIISCHQRWKNVFLENLNYRELISKWDSPTTTFYLDPPYEGVETDYYEINKTQGFNHYRMLNTLKRIDGSYCVSYYNGPKEIKQESKQDSPLIIQYKDIGCTIHRKRVAKHLTGGVDKKTYATELLIIHKNKWASSHAQFATIKGKQIGDLFEDE